MNPDKTPESARLERLELLKDIQQARNQAKRGQTVLHDQALAYLIAKMGERDQ